MISGDAIELDRPGPSYTLDTVRELHAAEPATEWVLIIGQDQYAGLHTWARWQDLLQRVVLAVADRSGRYLQLRAQEQPAQRRALTSRPPPGERR